MESWLVYYVYGNVSVKTSFLNSGLSEIDNMSYESLWTRAPTFCEYSDNPRPLLIFVLSFLSIYPRINQK